MNTQSCPYGAMLSRIRKNEQKMPQWLLAARCEVVAANLRKIEKGITQPSITLAARLLMEAEADVGPCMASLAHETFGVGATNITPYDSSCSNQEKGEPFRSALLRCSREIPLSKHLFGPLLKEARTFYGVSQRKLAEGASYHLRNMLEVESGRRDPSVMTALAMVHIVGCNVSIFFTVFAECLSEKTRRGRGGSY